MPQTGTAVYQTAFCRQQSSTVKWRVTSFIKSYEDDFTNGGDKVERDNKGNWEEVNCKYSSVPTALFRQLFRNT